METEAGNTVLHPKERGTEQGKRKGRSQGIRRKDGLMGLREEYGKNKEPKSKS